MEPINGKNVFFTEETFLRVIGPNSFQDWLVRCLNEQGYTTELSENQQESKPPQTNSVDKKELPPRVQDRSKLRCLQKPSSLTHGQQKRYLELFQKYILTPFQKQPTPAEIRELTELESLQAKVSAEQGEFLKCLESIAKSAIAEYNTLLPDARKYIEEKLHHQHNLVNQYPKNYSTTDVFPIKKKIAPGQTFNLVFQKTVLQMGQEPKVFLPDTKSTKPVIPTSYEKIVRQFPPLYPKKDENIWNHEPCSKDTNSEILADQHGCDVVLSSSVLHVLVDNHSPNYDRDWQIPFVIRTRSGVSDSQQKVVFLDKPLCAKVLTNREKNTLYHKYALKAFITRLPQSKTQKNSQGKTGTNNEIKPGLFDSSYSTRSGSSVQASDCLFETDTSIDDLETFGSFGKSTVTKPRNSVSRKENIFKLPSMSAAKPSEMTLPKEKVSVEDVNRKPDLDCKVLLPKKNRTASDKCKPDSVCLVDTEVTFESDGKSLALTCSDNKREKNKAEMEILKSDADSDEDNLIIIDCEESWAENEKATCPDTDLKPSDVFLAKSVSSTTAPNADEYQDSPLSPDPESTSQNQEPDQHRDSIDNTSSQRHQQCDKLNNRLTMLIPLEHCDQDSPRSPNDSYNINQDERDASGSDSKSKSCISDIPQSPDIKEKGSKKSLFGKTFSESETDSHDENLVIDIPAESENENPQVFLSPRALRALRRSNRINRSKNTSPEPVKPVSSAFKSGGLLDRNSDNNNKRRKSNEQNSCESGQAGNGETSLEETEQGCGDVTKRKRGRPSKERIEKTSKKIKTEANSDMSEKPIDNVTEEHPDPHRNEPENEIFRKDFTSKAVGVTPLDSILQLQNQMLTTATTQPHTQCEEDISSKRFKEPDQSKITYNLWDFSGLKLLIRMSSHGTLREYPNKLYPVCIVPKLEYQAKFGVEQITQSEMSRSWMSCLIKPNTHLIRGRINAQTSEIIMLEDLDMTKILQPSIPFVPQEFFCFLHGLFSHLKQLSTGTYLLSHSKGENYVSILKSIDRQKRGSYDLHFDHKVFLSTSKPCSTVPWIPIDPTIILPFHRKNGRVPATFEPKDFRKGQKKNKRKGKKK